MDKKELNKALEAMKISKKESQTIKGGDSGLLCTTCTFDSCVACVSCYGCVACTTRSTFGD